MLTSSNIVSLRYVSTLPPIGQSLRVSTSDYGAVPLLLNIWVFPHKSVARMVSLCWGWWFVVVFWIISLALLVSHIWFRILLLLHLLIPLIFIPCCWPALQMDHSMSILELLAGRFLAPLASCCPSSLLLLMPDSCPVGRPILLLVPQFPWGTVRVLWRHEIYFLLGQWFAVPGPVLIIILGIGDEVVPG